VNNASHNCLGEIFVNQLRVCDLVLVPIAFIVYFNLFVQLNWTKCVHGEVSKFVLIISKVSAFCFGYNVLKEYASTFEFFFSKIKNCHGYNLMILRVCILEIIKFLVQVSRLAFNHLKIK
jgi:hypothetical protein